MVFGLLGFLDAIYLTIKELTHTPVACSIVSGCENVLTSKYAYIGNMPVSMLGVGYYLLIMIVASLYLMHSKRIFAQSLKWLASIGLLASVVFVFLQLFVIHSICMYCFGSAINCVLIFFTAIFGINYSQVKDTTITPG